MESDRKIDPFNERFIDLRTSLGNHISHYTVSLITLYFIVNYKRWFVTTLRQVRTTSSLNRLIIELFINSYYIYNEWQDYKNIFLNIFILYNQYSHSESFNDLFKAITIIIIEIIPFLKYHLRLSFTIILLVNKVKLNLLLHEIDIRDKRIVEYKSVNTEFVATNFKRIRSLYVGKITVINYLIISLVILIFFNLS